MSGDYSRETLDPQRDFSTVLMQQGRVQLDADWNELVGLIDRRRRAETVDTIGRGVVPREAPDGFKIDLDGNTLMIGRGRMYVDGLLAENHGKAPLEFDPVLAEQRGTLPLPFNEQPYQPQASAPARGGPHLVYLDVWQREVTYLEQPELFEKAVGVDTTTRLQTVWQVRVLNNVGNIACDTPDAQVPNGWPDIIRPSAGRLSTAAVGVVSATDPCLIPPSGGYRGLENRLYRVEIHDGGPVGTATFKWSRDNAAIATRVTAINANLDQLTVALIGRDTTLRFKADDWIEITDDWREFAQQPGLIRQIEDAVDATHVITLRTPLPAGTFPTDAEQKTDPSRHTRIRRWDQQGEVRDTNSHLLVDLDAQGSTGLIPVPAAGTSIVLEDGVQITFNTPAGGTYRVGDYWNFAARTADASVEQLDNAPPRGIHHHYCRLALVTFPNSPTDCRPPWPPDFGGAGCDCSMCVTAESHNTGALTIQDAIDRVKTTGGTVCLGPGTFNLRKTAIQLTEVQSVRLRGHGEKTLLQYLGSGAAMVIDSAQEVTVEELALSTAAAATDPTPAVVLRNSSQVTVQRCDVARLGDSEYSPPAIGLAGILVDVLIRDNLLYAPVGIGNIAVVTKGSLTRELETGRPAPLITAELIVKDNLLVCARRGISFEGVSVHWAQTRLAGNLITKCTQAGIVACGFVLPGSSLDVHGNEIHVTGAGIMVGTDEARIDSNNISPLQTGKGGDGIVLTLGLDKTGLDRCQVFNNRIFGLAGHGIHVLNAIVRSAMIKNNHVEAVGGGGIVMDDASRAGQLTIENNQLFNLAPLANDPNTDVIGLRVVSTVRAEIVGNSLIDIGAIAAQSPLRAGIQVVNVGSARIDGNEVFNLGPAAGFLQDTAAIDCQGTFVRVDVTNNTIRRQVSPPRNLDSSHWTAVRIGALPRTGSTALTNRMFYMAAGDTAYAVIDGRVFKLPRGKEIVGVHCNLLEAYGNGPVVTVIASGALTFSHNRCLLAVPAQGDGAHTLSVAALVGAVVASGNYLEGPANSPALTLRLNPGTGPFTVLGNITSGPISVNGEALPAAWAALNVAAS
ncbi:MAG TPA: DUF6519 domain-containing protein [Verrucomicrobiae bacterium]|nr:DUF6519 domain-containing protein [Verrucomicrobiae bacterium]